MLKLLKDGTYIKYWLAVVLAFLGDGIARIAVIYLISKMTNDPFMIALVIFAQLVPSAVLGVFVGPLTDRFPKRLIMIFADIARAILMLSMIFFIHSPWMLLLLVLLTGVAKSIFEPARIASVPPLLGTIASRQRLRYSKVRCRQSISSVRCLLVSCSSSISRCSSSRSVQRPTFVPHCF